MKNIIFGLIFYFSISPFALAEETKTAPAAEEADGTTSMDARSQSKAAGDTTELELTTCTNGANAKQLVRKIWLTHGDAQGHPCKVHYAKVTEEPGTEKVLWQAAQDPEYCKNKAKAFVEKHVGWGWSCEGGAN